MTTPTLKSLFFASCLAALAACGDDSPHHTTPEDDMDAGDEGGLDGGRSDAGRPDASRSDAGRVGDAATDAGAPADAALGMDATVSDDGGNGGNGDLDASSDASATPDASGPDATAHDASADAAASDAASGDAATGDAATGDAATGDAGHDAGTGVCGGTTPHGCYTADPANDSACPAVPPDAPQTACTGPAFKQCVYHGPNNRTGMCGCAGFYVCVYPPG